MQLAPASRIAQGCVRNSGVSLDRCAAIAWNRPTARMGDASSVQIVEVSPRDGLQNEDVTVPTDAKLELIDGVVAAGLARVEATSFVNPARVPQLADADDAVRAASRAAPASTGRRSCSTTAAWTARSPRASARSTSSWSATDTFSRRNQGVDTAGGIDTWRGWPRRARAAGVRTHADDRGRVRLPVRGRGRPARVREVVAACAASRRTRSRSPTPSASASRRRCSALTAWPRESLPGVPLRWHFHNTRNTGYANAWTAVVAADPELPLALDASAGGIGGCPFAPGGHRQHRDRGSRLPARAQRHRAPASISRRCCRWTAGSASGSARPCPASSPGPAFSHPVQPEGRRVDRGGAARTLRNIGVPWQTSGGS